MHKLESLKVKICSTLGVGVTQKQEGRKEKENSLNLRQWHPNYINMSHGLSHSTLYCLSPQGKIHSQFKWLRTANNAIYTCHDCIRELISCPAVFNVIDSWGHNCYATLEDANVKIREFEGHLGCDFLAQIMCCNWKVVGNYRECFGVI